jgi:DNA-binding PadR family transcriptional regulator
MHGWRISRRVRQLSDGVPDVSQGSLHPALQRLEKEGLVASLESWRRFAAGLETVLRTT